MRGSTVSRILAVGGSLAASPQLIARYVRLSMGRSSPMQLGLPWFSWGAIDALDRLDLEGAEVLEWGGGGSTIYLLRRGAKVSTIEHDAAWCERLSGYIRREVGESKNWKLYYRPGPFEDHARRQQYLGADLLVRGWDLMIVDGLECGSVGRLDCIRSICASGGKFGRLILDDAWREEYSGVSEMLRGCEVQRHITVGPARMGVTQTDVYIRKAIRNSPENCSSGSAGGRG